MSGTNHVRHCLAPPGTSPGLFVSWPSPDLTLTQFIKGNTKLMKQLGKVCEKNPSFAFFCRNQYLVSFVSVGKANYLEGQMLHIYHNFICYIYVICYWKSFFYHKTRSQLGFSLTSYIFLPRH